MKYSVIVPIYNGEDFLNECIDSVVNQERKDVELILVNDGSTDSSLDICREYSEKNDSIILIDKKNTGSMDSYICGVKKATGDYTCFLDADDILSNNYFNTLDKYVGRYDVIIYDFYRMYKNRNKPMKINSIPHGEVSKVNMEKIKYDYYSNYKMYSFYRWDKVIKTEIIKNNIDKIDVRATYFEDLIIGMLNLISSNRIYYISDKLYYYRMRKGSVSHSVNKKIFIDNLIVEKEVEKIAINSGYGIEALKKLHHYFIFQYARLAMKADEKPVRIKISLDDIMSISGNEKKFVLFSYKFHLDGLFNFINGIRHLRKENKNYYF